MAFILLIIDNVLLLLKMLKKIRMKTIKTQLLAFFLFIGMFAHADEGMWFLMFIDRNFEDMKEMGLQLTPEEIYSINNSSLKDAIVQFNGGCTAEIISKEGLVLTNHHCGYGSIAELSSPENDYLTNGFWAKSKEKELKPKSLYVRFFVRMDNVSKRILGKVNKKMSEDERNKVIKEEIALIKKENSEDGKYVVSVKSFFKGNEYYYFVYQDFHDVRLVGTPPKSIGKYGGDTDNWEWPRHTGDFSMFRVYSDKDGNPAPYSTENIPLKPKHFLPVNIGGVKKDDFAMILGYPGRTNRWLPSKGVEQNVKYAYPAWIKASKLGMDIIKEYMDSHSKVYLNYEPKYARLANYWKNRIGMIEALVEAETSASKATVEEKFDKWASKRKNKKTYGCVISNINEYYEKTNQKSVHDNLLGIMIRSSGLSVFPYKFGNYLQAFINTKNEEKKEQLFNQIIEMINEFYEPIHFPLEVKMFENQLNLFVKTYIEDPSSNLHPNLPKLLLDFPFNKNIELEEEDKNEDEIANEHVVFKAILKSSIFSSAEKASHFIETNPNMEDLLNDPIYKYSAALIGLYLNKSEEQKNLEAKFSKSYRLLVDGLRKSGLSPIKYPDANSTLRLTYGKVSPLPPDETNDAKDNYYTTLKGTIAKYVPGDHEFDLPKRLLDLYKIKDYGRYSDKDGHMPVNFLTNNDITGGNSGSPVLNGKGELIGLAFDGNIEAMAGDVIFDKELQKTINVDIRYVLFIIDKYAGATNIINELSIIK